MCIQALQKKNKSLAVFASAPAQCDAGNWGFHPESARMRLSLSPTLKIVNNTNSAQTLKNFRLLLVQGRMSVKELIPQNTTDPSLPLAFGDTDPHSVLVPKKGGEQTLSLHFTFDTPVDSAPHFDGLVLRYDDQNSQTHDLLLARCKGEWEQGVFRCPTSPEKLPPFSLSIPHSDEDKRLFMQLIQEPITRMSTISTIFKGLAAAIVAGISTLNFKDVNLWILGLSFVPVIAFAILDMYYLRMERGFRYLYNQVRLDRHPVDFKILPYPNEINKDPVLSKIVRIRYRDLVSAPCIWVFYLPMVIISVIVFIMKYKGVI